MTKFLEHRFFEKRPDLGLLILRLSIGFLMLLHGIAKLQYGIEPIEGLVEQASLPQFFAYGVYIGEVLMPILIMLGIATRAASAVFAFNCLVAALLAHSEYIFSIGDTGGWVIELLGLYFFGALALVFTGGGKYAFSKEHIWD